MRAGTCVNPVAQLGPHPRPLALVSHSPGFALFVTAERSIRDGLLSLMMANQTNSPTPDRWLTRQFVSLEAQMRALETLMVHATHDDVADVIREEYRDAVRRYAVEFGRSYEAR